MQAGLQRSGDAQHVPVIGAWNRRRFIKALALGACGLPLGPGLVASAANGLDPRPVWRAIGREQDARRRSAWAQEGPLLPRLYAASPYYLLTVHHQGAGVEWAEREGDVVQVLRTIAQAHRKQGYGDMAYHAVIDRSGRIWEGRSLRYQGAHVSGHNPGNIGVMLLGNFEKQRPSARQLDSLATVIRTFCDEFDIMPGRVVGHRDLASTLCPGKRLYTHLDSLRPRI